MSITHLKYFSGVSISGRGIVALTVDVSARSHSAYLPYPSVFRSGPKHSRIDGSPRRAVLSLCGELCGERVVHHLGYRTYRYRNHVFAAGPTCIIQRSCSSPLRGTSLYGPLPSLMSSVSRRAHTSSPASL